MLYKTIRLILRILYVLIYRLKVVGKENIPKQGGVMLCSNHVNLLDPTLVGTPVDREVHFMAKEELFKIPVLGSLIAKLGAFPVKRGGVSRESIRNTIKILNEGKVFGIFPEGTRRKSLGMGKKGAASFALRSEATVIPVAIIGSYTPFRKLKIIYGEPVDLSEFKENSEPDRLERATDKIMSNIEILIKKNT
ncbi:lysophospholipid acyltransferase family protein [Chengkuizengella axinellae]|uniref:Lysophospholipid acyltransferase family protein n=1 Tax=Chengkuizengella axinellae TaxID=3064388 RepID=A0ABT9IY93_9BACL|nr:lysophospholipid acyltransferase family protein [Chengkuizengella sp. 2205SS18-9]MDP5273779.1 lysophospholipid acyltransferase family protein [Chengkuizengella sp. 2205SS18-9]